MTELTDAERYSAAEHIFLKGPSEWRCTRCPTVVTFQATTLAQLESIVMDLILAHVCTP